MDRSALACGELSGFADESDLPFNHYTDYDKYVQIRSICPGHVLSSDSFRPAPQQPPSWQRRREEWEAVSPLLDAPAAQETDFKPLISIVICAYNAAAHLPWAIRSVCKQSCREWELIIIDDASDDGTDAAIHRLVPASAQISVIRHEHNRGKAASLNTALEYARGSWLLELDADDWLPVDSIARLVEAVSASEDNTALIYGNHGQWHERSQDQLVFRDIHVPAPLKDGRQLLETAMPLIPSFTAQLPCGRKGAGDVQTLFTAGSMKIWKC